jgi:hypothetical protein
MKAPAKAAPGKEGVICCDSVYTIREFSLRAKMGRYAFRKARAAGLRVIECGGKSYILGADFLDFLKRQGATK